MPKQKVTTVSSDFIDQFLNMLIAKGKAANTSRAYGTDLKVFLLEMAPADAVILVEDFEKLAMEWLNAHRRGEQEVSPKTTARRVTSLRSFARWARIEIPDLLEYSAPHPSRPVPHPLPEGIDGVRRLIANAHFDYHAAYLALCGLCGLRSSEALAVSVKDINLTDMVLTVHGKGDRMRLVPVSEEAWDALIMAYSRAFLENRPTIVGLKDRAARRMVTTLGKRCGLRRSIASHDLRATFASAVYDRTKDIRLVQELLGHSSIETTQIYTEIAMPKMREAVKL